MKTIFIYGEREAFKNYAEALEGCGCDPLFSREIGLSENCRALLLPGGGDIDPARYGQENNGSRQVDLKRDQTEWELVDRFLAAGKPILGICRGIQVLNAALGGDLIQDLPTASTHQWEEESGDKVHLVETPEKSFLRPLYGKSFPVNSAHHQAAGNIAPCLTVSASAADGVVEALENKELRIYGVQWHPERMAFRHTRPDTVDGRILFEFFLGLL